MSNTPDEPLTHDERTGMAWWNALPMDERRRWLTGDSAKTPAEAWAMFKHATHPCEPRRYQDRVRRLTTSAWMGGSLRALICPWMTARKCLAARWCKPILAVNSP
jgi:hypothetical protein